MMVLHKALCHGITCVIIGMNRCFSASSFCTSSGRDSRRRVWPVGAVSKTVTVNSLDWAYLQAW